MKKCVFCEKEFEKLSCEHIIPNALCGHLKSSELLCSQCNSDLGKDVDSLLNGKFDAIINLFGLERENGNTPPAPAKLESGRPCSLSKGGQPIGNDVQFDLSVDTNNNVFLSINAPENNQKLLGNEISKYIAMNKVFFIQHGIDYKKAIPTIKHNVLEKIKNDEVKHLHIQEKIQFEFVLDGADFYRAILKILYMFLLHHRKDVKTNRKDIVNKIKTGEGICDSFFYCFDPETLFVHKHVSLYHSIGIKSFRKEGKLLGFIDLFGITPYICVLDDNYDGEDIMLSYEYDLLRKKEGSPEIVFSETTVNLKDKYDFQKTTKEHFAHYTKKWNNLLRLWEIYTIPDKIMQDLLATVNYDSSVEEFFSVISPQMKDIVVSGLDVLFPQKEKGCSTLEACIYHALYNAFASKQ